MTKMTRQSMWTGLAAFALAVGLAPSATATVIADPAGDFLATYTGPQGADLDVTSLKIGMSGGNLNVHTVLNGNVGLTPGGFYVYGVNRGAGVAGFAALGLDRVLFDSVVIIRQDRSGTIVIGGVPTVIANFATFASNMIDFTIDPALLPSTGFTPDRYGWNLWPRAPGGGFANISDFAPNNATIAAVPELASWAMMLSGFALAGGILRRRPSHTRRVIAA